VVRIREEEPEGDVEEEEPKDSGESNEIILRTITNLGIEEKNQNI
jgi:hypothetical protein